MKTLIIDTSYSNAFSVGISWEGNILSISSTFELGNSTNFWAALDRLFSISNISRSSIEVVAVSIGPGPFTSLRNGISIARTISQTMSIPLTKFSLIEVVEYMFRDDPPIILFDGRAGKFLVKRPNSGLELVSIKDFTFEGVARIVSVGCGKILRENGVKGVLNFDFLPIDVVNEIVRNKVESEEFYHYNEVLPIYYKSPGMV